ncbi:MAG: 30S ribosomal protein S12 methylthiotransferase RimO [Bacteroidetes bacterium]|nr:30S ribosomal protein S12 methylthiotransferase RimO [Bacteroidota bacterium]
MKPHQSIRIITLGCAKNMVDSEVLMGQLKVNNIKVLRENDKGHAHTVVINTCGFINDAREESIDTILGYIEEKKKGRIKNVFVMGCLSERFREPLLKEIPEVDEYFGVHDIAKIVERMGAEFRQNLVGDRMLTTPNHYAYLKIAEGCNRSCSFCAIPGIRGQHISKSMEDIVLEATKLAKQGVKEILLISQDLTYYGLDLYKKQMLPELVEKLSDLKLFDWIRLHYLYPTTLPSGLIDTIASRPDVCNYIDIPLQHINNRILKSMKRGVTAGETRKLISQFRQRLPEMAIRTAFIVGYPGETEDEFNELKQFIKETRFDRVGVFTYSHEEDTAAFRLKDDIPEKAKLARASELMEIQEEISRDLNALKVGKTFKVLIDRQEGEYFVGRTEFDSPEIDNEVLINVSANLKIGDFCTVKITGADAFDLYGCLTDNHSLPL